MRKQKRKLTTEDGKADVDEQIEATACDHGYANRWEEDRDQNDQKGGGSFTHVGGIERVWRAEGMLLMLLELKRVFRFVR
jgi:hypothetical protein